ncbi:hypothetical protein SXCC_00656 [Gluconacetobacter sp. SXCC-1]|nr:hypothetical protein SXCC_00656 [Gluconacetobacter sp. SXCC-1]
MRRPEQQINMCSRVTTCTCHIQTNPALVDATTVTPRVYLTN